MNKEEALRAAFKKANEYLKIGMRVGVDQSGNPIRVLLDNEDLTSTFPFEPLIIEPIPRGKTLQDDEVIFIKISVREYFKIKESKYIGSNHIFQLTEAQDEH